MVMSQPGEHEPEARWPEGDWRHEFIKAFRAYGIVTLAAKQARRGRTSIYEERKKNEEFAEAWAEAENIATDILEAQAITRATHHEKPSDTLLIFLLKARRPEKFREQFKLDHAGEIKTSEGFDLSRLTDKELSQLEALQAKAMT